MHPTIFRLGPITIASYGLMIATGLLIAVWVGAVRAKKLGEDPMAVLDLSIWVALSGILGARMMYVFIQGWQEISSQPFVDTMKQFINIRGGGLSFTGGLALAVPVGILYLRRKKLPVWQFADIAAPSLALGMSFARIGCFLNGCCFGIRCDLDSFFGVEFATGSIPYIHYYGFDDVHGGVVVYVTQLMSSFNALVIFLVLTLFFRHRRFRGQVFWLFVLLYGVIRFSMDFLRGDMTDSFFGGLFLDRFTTAQMVCFVGVILSIIMQIVLWKRHTREARKI